MIIKYDVAKNNASFKTSLYRSTYAKLVEVYIIIIINRYIKQKVEIDLEKYHLHLKRVYAALPMSQKMHNTPMCFNFNFCLC